MEAKDILLTSIEKFDKLTSRPEDYLSVQDDLCNSVKALAKNIYDFSKKEEIKLKTTTALPQLIIQDFDEEQIWQELELQNEDKWTDTLTNVSRFLSNNVDFKIPIKIVEDEPDDGIHSFEEEDENEEEQVSSVEELKINGTDRQDKTEAKSSKNKKVKETVVDDQFFRLREMEEFLNAEDKVEMMKGKKSMKKSKSEESDEDEEEEIDLFQGWESEEGDDSDEENGINPKYAGFFDKTSDDEGDKNNKKSDDESDDLEKSQSNDESEYDSEIDLQDSNIGKKKKVSFNIPQPASDDSDSDLEKESSNKNEAEKILSQYELRQQRLKKKIGHLENTLLEDKPWTMKGEIDANSRPQNSLLEEVVDFDISSRPAPIITEETTLKLQDIIIQRIKDKTWDDVERKNKPTQEVHEFKKQLVLDQEKSKLSLAQVYEKEYIKQREALDPNAEEKEEEEPKEHTEIRKIMTNLFEKLNALSNFHYTPKVAVAEVRIISNMPAITMEEVAPVMASDAALLAPEEIKRKPKGDIIGKSERTDTDKNRERRQKKTRQREKEKEKQKREKLVNKLNPGLGNKYSKEKVSRLLDKVTKDRNVDKMEISNDKSNLTSSTAFFSQLQDEVQNTIKSKLKMNNKNNKKSISAKQLKL